MTRLNTLYPFMLLFVLSCLQVLSCTPAPLYKGGGGRAALSKPEPERREEAPAKAGIVLRYPLGGTGKAEISSPFGLRTHPAYGTREFHQGVDFEAETGDDVYAAAPGTVVYAGRQKGYGRIVIIDHGQDISSVYAHLSKTLVHEGETVVTGQRIGKVGVSGNATGSHLHFELRISGEAVDPLDYMEIR